MKKVILALAALVLIPYACLAGAKDPVVFAVFAGDGEQLRHTLVLAESIRNFGGEFKKAPIWVYTPNSLLQSSKVMAMKLGALKVEVKTSEAPEESRDFPFAGHVFAAAKAETEARGKAQVLVWMDDDTVVLKEPREFILAKGKSLGYRPVTQQNIGSSYAEGPDAFWGRLFERLSVPQSAMFPMVTVADGRTIRPYFNAGLLVVRPGRGILKKWADDFTKLGRDSVIVGMCREDESKRIFLHQAVLAGSILNLLKKNEMTQLSDRYNYPVFAKEMYGANKEFDDLGGVATLRYDVYFQKPAPDWAERLKGPAGTVSWLRERLGPEQGKKGNAATKMRYRFLQGGGKPQ